MSMYTACRIRLIEKELHKKRQVSLLFDDDRVTEEVKAYFKKKHYKIYDVNSWGKFCICKRWWMI